MSESPRSSVLATVGVRPEETRLVGWLSAVFFVTQTTHGLGLNAADALFFLRFGVEHLPSMILLSGFVVMAVMLAFSAGLSSTRNRNWLWWVPLASAGWLVVERAGIAVEVGGVYPVVWQSAQVLMMLTFTLMWTAAAEVCTTRQAKRLYPVFASAGIAGGILGNAITGPAAALVGTPDLLLIQAVLLVASGLLVLGTARRFFEAAPPGRRPSATAALQDVREGLRVTIGTPLIRWTAAAALASSLLLFLVVFPFSEVVAASFDTETGVAGYLGVFASVATAITLVVSLFVANRLFARIGVIATLLILPLTYAAGFAVWLVEFDLATASIVRGAQWVVVNALGGTALINVFNVLRGRRRTQVLSFVTAIPSQLGVAAAGLLLLIAEAISDTARLILSLAIAAATAVVVLKMRPAYVAALVMAVERGFADVFTVETTGIQKPALDADALTVLRSRLEHPDPGRRRVAVSVLGRVAGGSAADLVARRIADPDPAVRLAGFDVLVEHDPSAAAAAAKSLTGDADVRVRRHAVRFLAERSDPAGIDSVGLLSDRDPSVRAAAARLVGGERGRETVADLLSGPDADHVVAGLEAAAAGVRPTTTDLTRFVGHHAPSVRRAAAVVLARDPSAREHLGRLLDDVSPSVRSAAARLLAETPEGAAVLWEVLTSTGSVRASEAAVGALAAGRATPFEPWIDRELDRAEMLARARAALEPGTRDGEHPTRRFLVRVLAARERRLEGWVLEALGAGEGMASVVAVGRGAFAEDPETRAQALEALEAMEHRTQVRRLVGLLEGGIGGVPVDTRTALWQLAEDFDRWLRALAVRCLHEELAGEVQRLVAAVRDDVEDLVRGAVPTPDGTLSGPDGRLDTIGRVVALHGVGLLSGLDPEELELVADATEVRTYRPGSAIFRRDEPGDEMLVIVDGSAEVGDPATSPIVRGHGEYVGELAVLRRGRRSADVTAGPDGARVLVVAGTDLRAILRERPEATVAMLRTLAGRIADARPA